jgi:predicted AlkP superfamily pyrophosphatase or phosphodiesterase
MKVGNEDNQMNPAFVVPRYDENGFAGIPGRIKSAFASGNYEAVVLFLVDGFGWRFFERFQDAPFLKRIARGGTIEKLSSQFPSTTAAHLTTIHTGLPVGVSGIYEWFIYEPSLDRIIAPLLFSYSGTRERETLRAAKVNPSAIYPRGTFYSELKQMGVAPYVFGIRDYTPSTFSKAVAHDAELLRFITLPEALINIGLLLEKQNNPTYIHLYFDRIDTISHEYGPGALQTEAEIESFLLIMERYVEQMFKGKRILFLMTADHGQADVNPKTTIYLNTDRRFKGLERFIKSNQSGQLLIPAGSARDLFLHVKDDLLDEAQAFLTRRLEGKADVIKVDSLMEAGYFGPELSPRFHERVANIVILPYAQETVWWYEKDRFEQRFHGHHGGLTAEEMEIALYSYTL